MHQNPIIRHAAETQDGRAYRISDFLSDSELRELDLYREVYGPLGNTNYQIAFTLPHTPGRILGIALSRGDEDYTDADRDLLNRARPALIQTFRNAIEHEALRRELAGLRRRQRPHRSAARGRAHYASRRRSSATSRSGARAATSPPR